MPNPVRIATLPSLATTAMGVVTTGEIAAIICLLYLLSMRWIGWVSLPSLIERDMPVCAQMVASPSRPDRSIRQACPCPYTTVERFSDSAVRRSWLTPGFPLRRDLLDLLWTHPGHCWPSRKRCASCPSLLDLRSHHSRLRSYNR